MSTSSLQDKANHPPLEPMKPGTLLKFAERNKVVKHFNQMHFNVMVRKEHLSDDNYYMFANVPRNQCSWPQGWALRADMPHSVTILKEEMKDVCLILLDEDVRYSYVICLYGEVALSIERQLLEPVGNVK